MPPVTGFDYDDSLHKLTDVCALSPDNIPIACWTHRGSETMENLLGGKWPQKRNLIITVDAKSVEEGKRLLDKLRKSAERNYSGLY